MIHENRIIQSLDPLKIYRLVVYLEQHLSKHENLKMWVEPPNNLKIDYIRRKGGGRGFYLKVNGPYFSRREAISFYPDGRIGFCGWASGPNRQPFVEAFSIWALMNFPDVPRISPKQCCAPAV
jgi:hypothetical protein